MKKSKLITIGLLALSIASCHHRHRSTRPPVADWSGTDSYISSDGGGSYYETSPGLPFWFWYSMMARPYGGFYYGPSVIFYNHYSPGWGAYRTTYSAGGRSYGFSGSSSRGGFGGLGRAVGA